MIVRNRFTFHCWLCVIASMILGAICSLATGEEPAATGFSYSLLKGDTFDGWIVTGCQAEVKEGVIRATSGEGMIRTENEYGDFILELEWRPLKESDFDSGIFFRAALPPEGKPWPQKYQVNLKQNDEGNVGPLKEARSKGLIKPGEWNQMQLTVIGDKASLQLNGKDAWTASGVERPRGYIAIQVEATLGGPFEFRQLKITELDAKSLITDDKLTGFTGVGGEKEACWSLEEGMIVCSGKKGPWLRYDQPVQDFNLRFDYQLLQGGNSGIYVRVPEDGNHHGKGAGVEIQLLDDTSEKYKQLKEYQYTGSIYAILAAKNRLDKPAPAWNTMEIDCRANRYRITHNGVVVLETDDTQTPELAERRVEGYLGLQNHTSKIWFRNLRLGPSLPELPAAK